MTKCDIYIIEFINCIYVLIRLIIFILVENYKKKLNGASDKFFETKKKTKEMDLWYLTGWNYWHK